MGFDPAITVDVTVSAEFRQLLAVMRAGLAWPDHLPLSEAVTPVATLTADGTEPVPGSQVTAPDVPDWRDIRLRRDGGRPIIFRGLALLTRQCQAEVLQGTAEMRLAVYLADDDLLYASLVFDPPETACARPAHHCQPIHDIADFELFLNGWQPELCLDAIFASDVRHRQNLAASQTAVRSAFKSMAADCLCKGVLQL